MQRYFCDKKRKLHLTIKFNRTAALIIGVQVIAVC
jgi:hypothetical protein